MTAKRWLARPYEATDWQETDIEPTDELRRFLEFKPNNDPLHLRDTGEAVPDMLTALLGLTNAADGLSFREAEIRQVIGNTNWCVLRVMIDAAREAIARAEREDF